MNCLKIYGYSLIPLFIICLIINFIYWWSDDVLYMWLYYLTSLAIFIYLRNKYREEEIHLPLILPEQV
jgi:hypothetical protein